MRIGIIGAGISGLSAAYELAKKGHKVSIFERSNVPGGLGTYIPIGKTYIERYYHHFFQSDHCIKKYASEFGILDKLKFYNSKTSIFIDGVIYPFNSPKDLLTYAPFSILDKIRCAVTTGFLKFFPFPLNVLDKISAKNWIKMYAGNRVYEKLWGPLLEGKFSQFADAIPALWLWGRVYDRSFQLGYFDGSVKILFDALVKKIQSFHGELHLGVEINGIEAKNNKVYIFEDDKKFEFDKVIVTTVSPIAEKLFTNKISQKYREFLKSIDHLGAVCLILELSRPIQSQYWVNICEKNSPVLVMVEHTNLISSSDYEGKHIVYLANYLHRDDPRFKLSDEEIVNIYSSVLKKMNKKYSKSWIIKSHISRVPRAQTIFGIDALRRIPQTKTELENVYMINIDQMYPHDRNLNQGIQLGVAIASMI